MQNGDILTKCEKENNFIDLHNLEQKSLPIIIGGDF